MSETAQDILKAAGVDPAVLADGNILAAVKEAVKHSGGTVVPVGTDKLVEAKNIATNLVNAAGRVERLHNRLNRILPLLNKQEQKQIKELIK